MQHKPFGLYELDPASTILYCEVESAHHDIAPVTELVGRNFSEVTPFHNISELQRYFDSFRRGNEQAVSFVFYCDYGDEDLPVMVILARSQPRYSTANNQPAAALLVQIRQIH